MQVNSVEVHFQHGRHKYHVIAWRGECRGGIIEDGRYVQLNASPQHIIGWLEDHKIPTDNPVLQMIKKM